MHLTNLNSLLDYNELLAISVGLNLAYVVISHYINDSLKNSGFFELLSLYLKDAIDRIIRKKERNTGKLNEFHSKLNYYKSLGKLPPEDISIIDNIDMTLTKYDGSVDLLVECTKVNATKVISIKYYSHISLLLAFYGIVLMFIAPLEKKYELNFSVSIIFTNCLTLFFIFYSIICEFPPFLKGIRLKLDRNKNGKLYTLILKFSFYIHYYFSNKLIPRYRFIALSIVFYILLILFNSHLDNYYIYYFEKSNDFIYNNINAITIVILFSNFILYFTFCILRVERLVIRFKRKLKALKIKERVNNYSELIESLKEKIDNDPLVKISNLSIVEKPLN